MTKILLAICLFALGLVTTAQPSLGKGAPQQEVLTRWYNENGELTGSEPAAPGTTVGNKEQADSSGEHSWSYTVRGRDQSACPAKLPVGSIN